MRKVVLAALSTALLAVDPVTAGAQTRFFLGGGPTGTSDFGFRGGWGGVLGVEHRIRPGGAVLIRAEVAAVPSTNGPYYFIYPASPSSPASLGESGPGSSDATLLSLMAGLRLGGSGKLRPYLDALVGIGYLNDPTNVESVPMPMIYPTPSVPASEDRANIAISLGPGIAFRPPVGPTWFADVHYDFYFVEGAGTPVIPIRLGLMVP